MDPGLKSGLPVSYLVVLLVMGTIEHLLSPGSVPLLYISSYYSYNSCSKWLYLHFVEKEMEVPRSNVPKAAQLANGRLHADRNFYN